MIQTRKYRDLVVTAVVIRTGYLTTKVHFVRNILNPPPMDFQFEKDSHKFMADIRVCQELKKLPNN